MCCSRTANKGACDYQENFLARNENAQRCTCDVASHDRFPCTSEHWQFTPLLRICCRSSTTPAATVVSATAPSGCAAPCWTMATQLQVLHVHVFISGLTRIYADEKKTSIAVKHVYVQVCKIILHCPSTLCDPRRSLAIENVAIVRAVLRK